jgi:hypothetical protein
MVRIPSGILSLSLLAPLWAATAQAGEEHGIVTRLSVLGPALDSYTLILSNDEGSTQLPLADDGEGTDVLAGDNTWTGTAWIAGDTFEIALETSDGTLPGGSISWDEDQEKRDLVLILDGDRLTVSAAVAREQREGAPQAEPVQVEQSARDSAPGMLAVAAMLLLAGLAWLLGFLRRWLDQRALRALVGARSHRLEGGLVAPHGDSLHRVDGAQAAALLQHLVSRLVAGGPVVVIAPSDVVLAEHERVFRLEASAPGLARALRALVDRSLHPPLVIALVLGADLERLESLAARIPDTVSALYLVDGEIEAEDLPCFSWSHDAEGWHGEAQAGG